MGALKKVIFPVVDMIIMLLLSKLTTNSILGKTTNRRFFVNWWPYLDFC